MHTFDETSCAKGKPLRSLWTADEARMVKHILNNLTVKQWNLPSTEVERDLSGDWTIWIPEGGGGGGSIYSSYFTVKTETTDLGCFIIVTDGGEDSPAYSGAVKINGVRVDVALFAENQSVEGLVYVWLYSYMTQYGPAARVVTANELSSKYPLPGNLDGGLVYACQLLGRVTIVQNEDLKFSATSINQDYLHGGEHVEHLWAQCELAEDEGE